MAKTFPCSVVTPEAPVLDAEVTYANVPAHDGQLGFMANHAPLLIELGKGKLELTLADHSKKIFMIEGGFAQMNGKQLSILSEKASAA